MADLDCSNVLQPCNCTSTQTCIQIGRSSTECARNTCIDNPSSKGGGGSSLGAVAGQAVGGVVGGLVLIVVVYWFWWRRRRASGKHAFDNNGGSGFKLGNAFSGGASRNKAGQGIKGLKDFRIGNGNGKGGNVEEKQRNTTRSANSNNHPSHMSTMDNMMASPGPGEEDAQPVLKRQSLRFDSKNNGTTTSRRSLSGANNHLSDNPFGDHHSSTAQSNGNGSDDEDDERGAVTREEGGGGNRQSSAPTISEFSFRSSHSTNIIPIAYIPAHSSQNSTIDMTGLRESRAGDGQRSSHAAGISGARPHSMATTLGGMNGNGDINGGGNRGRGSRASVPISLMSTETGGLHDSMMGGPGGNSTTFSRLFDRRASSALTESTSANFGTSNGFAKGKNGQLEIIAPSSFGATSPPLSTTPTMTKDGRPIRPPRAPGLDLKLPTPETMSSPPTSPGSGFPWSNNKGALSPSGRSANFPHIPVPPQPPSHQRDNYLSSTFASGRASAYSTFSQATDSSGSHMSYILEAPQIVTPVSAGHVQVQTLNRAAARAVKLPSSNSANALSPIPSASETSTLSPTSPGGNIALASSPLARQNSSSSSRSHLGDNPFDDEMAVRIDIPSGKPPALPLTPTFGTGGLPTPAQMHSRPGTSNAQMRDSISTHGGRRDSDISIFTSSDAIDSNDVGAHGTARNSFASSFVSNNAGSSSSLHAHSGAGARGPSPSSYVGTAGHSGSSNKSTAPSLSSQSADEVILAPPNRPFVDNGGDTFGYGQGAGFDSRHNSAAVSMRSGYGSVLDGIPFNLSLSPEADARHSQASASASARDSQASEGGPGMSVPFHFGGMMRPGSGARSSSGGGGAAGGMRDSSATYRTSFASSSTHAHGGNDKRDTSYSLASEWNGAFAGMPIMMGGAPGEEAVPEVPSMYQSANHNAQPNNNIINNNQNGHARDSVAGRDERYSTDSLALAAAVARQFDEGNN